MKRPLKPDEVAYLREALATLGVHSRDAEPHVRAADIPRHQFIIEAGGNPDDSGLVMSGIIREFYVDADGVERTRGFAQPGDTFGSLSDALMKRPSRVFVRAEAPSRVLFLPWSLVVTLAKKSLEWERLQSRLYERLYLRKATREYELLALDAMGRYQSLLAQHPNLERAISQAHIASYLGITPVHLSRLRKKLGTSKPSRRKV